MKKLTLYVLCMLLAGITLNSCKKTVLPIKTATATPTVSTIAYGSFSYITVDKSGNIYALLLKSPADTIYKFTPTGIKSMFFIPPVTMDDDTVVTHVMNCLTTDSLGNIYTIVGNGISNQQDVFKIAPDGTSAVAYNININGDYYEHTRIALDVSGDFYYDANGLLYKIAPGGTVALVVTHPTVGVFTPDAYGNIYYQDNQQELQKMAPAGTVTTVVSASTIGGAIYDLGADVFGNVYLSYLSQSNAPIIGRLTQSDSLKTVISSAPGHVDGPVTTARITLATSEVTDAKGNLYFIDQSVTMPSIRKITF
jgi:hypothetical protein